MPSTLLKQLRLHQESLTSDELFEWYASSLFALRAMFIASKLQRDPQPVIIKKILKDADYRAQCIEVLKALDLVEWSADRRTALAKKARDSISAALDAGNVHVTNQVLSQSIDLAAIAVQCGISAAEINAVFVQQSGREKIYAHMDRQMVVGEVANRVVRE